MPVLAALSTLTTLQALHALEPDAFVLEGFQLAAAEAPYIEARELETVIRARPYVPFRRLATVSRGTRLMVRGVVPSRDSAGCNGKPWYAVYPFGFVCSLEARPTQEPPDLGPALAVAHGDRLPFSYALVREDGVLMYEDAEGARALTPIRTLTKGMSLAVRKTVTIDDARYFETMDGQLVPREGVGWYGRGSSWQGVELDGQARGPVFAWVRRDGTPVHAAPDASAGRVRNLPRRARVPLLERSPQTSGSTGWWRIAEGEWVEANRLNEVVVIPELHDPDNTQWIDIDLGEQVLVAYRGQVPVFATLVSTGRRTATPRGNYPIWAKVASMTMDNQAYEDQAYMLQGVPWVLLFQAHNALHGAYWHDRFGEKRSHGCVNLSPADARWLFEWVSPSLPAGWTGYLPGDLSRSPVVHIRDSSQAPGLTFTQERPIGPPDLEEEKKKLAEAEARRKVEQELPVIDPWGDNPLETPLLVPPSPP